MAAFALGYPIIVGSHNAHRMAALREVGGFAAHDADDLLLTLRYQGAKWAGVYVPKVIARGLAPVDWQGYLIQQRRWARSVLDIKLRLAVEHWYPGVLGRDATGAPVTLAGATFFRSLVQVALGSLQFYWDRSNLTASERVYVPGLPITGRPSEFGVRWTFMN
jgi:hypothetical protein